MPRLTWLVLGVLVGGSALVFAGCARPGSSPSPADSRSPGTSLVVVTDGCATATSPPAMAIDGTPQPANQEALDALAQRIQPYAEAHFADVYTGLELRSEQNRLRVFRVPSSTFDSWLLGTFAADCVEIVDAAHSAREVNDLATKITNDLAYWRAQHVSINTVSPRVDGSAVEVTTTTDVGKASAALVARYGTAIPIAVTKGDPPVLDPGVAVTGSPN
jgi:hypothetical protein